MTTNTLTAKAYHDRLVELLNEERTIAEDIKQLTQDAKEQGLRATSIKRLAKLEVAGNLEKEAEKLADLLRAESDIGDRRIQLTLDDFLGGLARDAAT